MKKITKLQFEELSYKEAWEYVYQLQAELDKKSVPSGNGMTVEEMVHKWWFTWMDDEQISPVYETPVKKLIEAIQPITVPQAFQPDWSIRDHMEAIAKLVDWSKRPWATALKIGYMTKDIMPHNDRIADPFMTVPKPLPTKVERARTRMEMIRALVQGGFVHSDIACHPDLKDSVLSDLCAAARIPLTVLEEV